MHTAYNYTGLIDVAAELMKLKRKEARQDTENGPAESTSIRDDDVSQGGSKKSERG